MVCQHNTHWSSNTLVPKVLEPNKIKVKLREKGKREYVLDREKEEVRNEKVFESFSTQ